MTIAIWLIVIIEAVRAAQNMMQLAMLKHDTGARDNAYAEFVKSLNKNDRQFVKEMLEEFDRAEREVEE